MQWVVSKEPEIYIPDKELIIRYPDHKISLTEITSKAGNLEKITRKMLSMLFEKLTELSISFQLAELKVEHDAEIEGWSYVSVRIKIDVAEEIFDEACNFLLTYTYSTIKPKDAIKVLLVFEHV